MVGYSVDGGLDGFDDNYCEKWESTPGATDLANVMPEVKAAFNGIAKAACVDGGKLILTGGAEKGYHAPGPYGHEGGWKLDVDPVSVSATCGRDTFLDLCVKYGCAAGDEGDHYDLAFNSEGGVGGTEVATPETYLGNGGSTNENISGGGKKNSKSPKGGGTSSRNEKNYDGFRIRSVGKDTVQITKLPDGKTFAEPIYPDFIMISDFVPKWALDAAATVTNVTDDSMIQWGKNNKQAAEGQEQNPEEESALHKEYDKFAEGFNKYKDERYEQWKKDNNITGTDEEANKKAYEQAQKDHPEQFQDGMYVGSDDNERKKASEYANKEYDYEHKLKYDDEDTAAKKERDSLQKEYDQFAKPFDEYKNNQYEAWRKANGLAKDGEKPEDREKDREAYQKAQSEHPEQFEGGIYVGGNADERKKAKDYVDKELDYEGKFQAQDKKDQERKEQREKDEKEWQEQHSGNGQQSSSGTSEEGGQQSEGQDQPPSGGGTQPSSGGDQPPEGGDQSPSGGGQPSTGGDQPSSGGGQQTDDPQLKEEARQRYIDYLKIKSQLLGEIDPAYTGTYHTKEELISIVKTAVKPDGFDIPEPAHDSDLQTLLKRTCAYIGSLANAWGRKAGLVQ